MTDFDYDSLQKKRICRNGRKKGRRKGCSLPSDRLTTAQWKRRNGVIMQYDLSKPMKWKDFTSMPVDIQQEYVNRLQERFQVGQAAIAAAFRVGYSSLSAYKKKTGLTIMRASPDSTKEFFDWFHGEEAGEKTAEDTAETNCLNAPRLVRRKEGINEAQLLFGKEAVVSYLRVSMYLSQYGGDEYMRLKEQLEELLEK